MAQTTIHVVAPDLASAWLEAMKRVFFAGKRIKTEYDREGDPPSFDRTALIEITSPILPGKKEAIPHIADMYGVMSIRGGYLGEIFGDKDSQIWESETSFPYTYHDRLWNYKSFNKEDTKLNPSLPLGTEILSINQIDYIIKKLAEASHSRRAQAITWRPYADPFREHCPCLQRLWGRVMDDKLHLHVSWRSRDLFRAFGANAVGMIAIQKQIAGELGVELGSYCDYSDSLHVYGQKKVIEEVIKMFDRVQNRQGLEVEYQEKLLEYKQVLGLTT